MAEIFNVDLPPIFKAKPGTSEEQQRELEEYLERLASSLDEMLKRVFNRLDAKDLWEIDGSETQLVTADELDMQTKKIINLVDPANAQDAATKASSEAAATAAGLWEVDGTEHQLKTGDAIDMQTHKIINLVDPTADQEAATKKFHDDDMAAEMHTTTGHDHDGTSSRKVKADDLEDGGITDGKFLKVDGGVIVGADMVVGDGDVTPVKLNTAQGEVSKATSGGASMGAAMMHGGATGSDPATLQTVGLSTSYVTNISLIAGGSVGRLTLPGGEYGFYPQTKFDTPGGFGTMYARQRYVTASGQDHWIFLLVDALTGDIRAGYSAPDHPLYGNGGDIKEVPHPFIGNDLTGLEIVILGKEDVARIKAKVTRKDTILTIVHRDYTIDVTKEEVYEPLHTGQFIDGEQVKIDELSSEIKVKKLKLRQHV